MKDIETIHIYCTPGVKQKLEKLAKADRRSLSAEVQYLVEKAWADQPKPTKQDLKG